MRSGWSKAAVVPLLVVLVSLALGGCGLGVIGHRTDPRLPALKATASDVDRSLLLAREQAALDPNEPYWAYRLGQLYLAADSLSEGEAALKQCLEHDPLYVPALSLLSKRYFETGRHQQAVDMLEALRSRPDAFPDGFPPVLATGLALHYDALDRLDQARALVAGVSPRDSDGGTSATVYVTLRGENPDSATALAATLVEQDPKSAVNQNNYGITRLRAADPAAARRAFLAAIELDPRLPGPYYNLAILDKYYMLDDDAAARWFHAYRERSQQDPDSLLGVFEKRRAQDLAGEER